MDLNAISMSRDHKWIVCGAADGASVWGAEIQKKAIEVEGTTYVHTVDISPDSTRFATSTEYGASVWNILTGERLVGPLQHNGSVASVKFSPNSDYIATLCPARNSIHIFDNHNGDHLIRINNKISRSLSAVTPLAWSSNGQQIFAVSSNHKIKSFDVSTGFQLVESQVHADNDVDCIALASNGNLLATFADHSISLWDTSTLTQIGPVIKDSHSQGIWSIALSLDCNYLATGGFDGNITIRNLSNILPDLYGPFLVSGCAFTTLACQTSHALSFPHDTFLGTYSKRTWTRGTQRAATTRRRTAFGLGGSRQQSTGLDSSKSLLRCNRKGHTDSFIPRNPHHQVHLSWRPTMETVMMIYSRYDYDPFLANAGFHDGMRSSYRLAHWLPYLTIVRYVMNCQTCFYADIPRASIPGIPNQAARS